LKLTAALPQGAQHTANRVAARFHLDPVGWFRSAGDARLLPRIADAVWNERYLEIRYQRPAGVVPRKVLPLGLVLKGGAWYLVAQIGGQPRTYRVSNILDLTVTEEHFERPRDFDLVRFWTTASRAYEVGLYRGKAMLRVSLRGMRRLDLFGSAVVQAVAETAGPPDADGWVKVIIPIEAVDQAAADLMRLGTDVEVIDPPELRHRIAEMAYELTQLYGVSPIKAHQARAAARAACPALQRVHSGPDTERDTVSD
jgi:predicted DNA-binding transcriptional regulator YafY